MPMQTGKAKQEKGKRYEEECAVFWAALLQLDMRRGRTGLGPDIEAVAGELPIHVECKRQETFRPYDWLKQAWADRKQNKPAVVQFRKNRGRSIIILDAADIMKVVAALAPYLEKWEDHPADRVDDCD